MSYFISATYLKGWHNVWLRSNYDCVRSFRAYVHSVDVCCIVDFKLKKVVNKKTTM